MMRIDLQRSFIILYRHGSSGSLGRDGTERAMDLRQR